MHSYHKYIAGIRLDRVNVAMQYFTGTLRILRQDLLLVIMTWTNQTWTCFKFCRNLRVLFSLISFSEQSNQKKVPTYTHTYVYV